MIQEKNLFYKKYLKPNNQETFQAFSQIQERVRLAIEDSKKKYSEKLLNNLDKLNGKCYWTIPKRFLTVEKFVAYLETGVFPIHFSFLCMICTHT